MNLPLREIPNESRAWKRFQRLSPWLLAAYWPLLVLLFHLPIEQVPTSNSPVPPDKTVHLIAYGILGFLVAWVSWPWGNPLGTRGWFGDVRRAAMVWALLGIHAGLDEFTQPWTGRHCDVADGWADMLGATSGIIVLALVARRPRWASWVAR